MSVSCTCYDNVLAKQQLDYLHSMKAVYPVNFKVAYAFSAIPARYYLENKMWKEAAGIKMQNGILSWESYPWQRANLHFARLLGSVHTGDLNSARAELKNLRTSHDILMAQKDAYKATQVMVQVKAGEAWIQLQEGNKDAALNSMKAAADMEDKTEKSPVTPGKVLPAKELLGDMFMQLNQPAEALAAYESDLQKRPNRFNGLYGAGLASEKMNNREKAAYYYRQLITGANSTGASRPELKKAGQFLRVHESTAAIEK